MSHELDILKEEFNNKSIDIEEFCKRVMKIFEYSMNGTAPASPEIFEKNEVTDILMYFNEKKKQFNNSKSEAEKCVIHDILFYTISRMDINEIKKSGIYN